MPTCKNHFCHTMEPVNEALWCLVVTGCCTQVLCVDENSDAVLLYTEYWLTFRLSGFPCGSAGKESTRNAGDLGSIPGLGISPGEGKGYPLRYSGLENPWTTSHGVAKSQTQLSDFHLHFLSRCLPPFLDILERRHCLPFFEFPFFHDFCIFFSLT